MGVDQIQRAVADMDRTTQLSAAQAEELAATSQSLESQAASMRQTMATFDDGDLPRHQ